MAETKSGNFTSQLNNMPSKNHGNIFHTDATMKLEYMNWSCTRDNDRDSTLNWNFKAKNNWTGFYGSGLYINMEIYINGTLETTQRIATGVLGGSSHSTSFNVSFDTTSESDSATVQFHAVCTGYSGQCCWGNSNKDKWWGPFTVAVPSYISEIPPTPPTHGVLYNQNDVVNGPDKPDWNFKANWWGESGGSFTIQQYNINIYKDGTNAGGIAWADKMVDYNFEDILPKCKPGETYDFYVDTYVKDKGWLGNFYLGSITLFKDGNIFYKNGTTKLEATMAYVKDTSGTKHPARYAIVKDTTGAKRIIDIYTTHYE